MALDPAIPAAYAAPMPRTVRAGSGKGGKAGKAEAEAEAEAAGRGELRVCVLNRGAAGTATNPGAAGARLAATAPWLPPAS